jgi:hypothetical protein
MFDIRFPHLRRRAVSVSGALPLVNPCSSVFRRGGRRPQPDAGSDAGGDEVADLGQRVVQVDNKTHRLCLFP